MRKASDPSERHLESCDALLNLCGGASDSPRISDGFTGRVSIAESPRISDGDNDPWASAELEKQMAHDVDAARAAAVADAAHRSLPDSAMPDDASAPLLHASSDRDRSRNSKEASLKSGMGKGTQWTASANLSKAFLGAASFELPWALKQSGIGAGVLSLCVFAVACAFTLKLLGRLRVHMIRQRGASPYITYVDIGRAAYGTAGVRAVNFGVIAMSLGVCAAYLVFVGTTLHSVFVGLDIYPALSIGSNCEQATDTGSGCIFLPLIITLPVFVFIALLEDYSKLAWTSLAGIFFVIVAMVSVMLNALIKESVSPGGLAAYPFLRAKYYPLFFGNAAFTFCIHTVALPIHASMRAPERDFENAVDRSTAFVAAINIIFATIAAIYFDGAGVQSNIVQNLPQKAQLVVLIKCLLCMVMILTYALFLQPVAEVLENVFWSSRSATRSQRRNMRFGVILLTLGLALAVPDFGLACNLVGSVANTLVGIILPPIFYLKLCSDSIAPRERTYCRLILAFGVVLFLVSTVISIIAIYGVHNPTSPLCRGAPFDAVCGTGTPIAPDNSTVRQ